MTACHGHIFIYSLAWFQNPINTAASVCPIVSDLFSDELLIATERSLQQDFECKHHGVRLAPLRHVMRVKQDKSCNRNFGQAYTLFR